MVEGERGGGGGGGGFFFQAEDGIRDYDVTGVQTCALPISVTDPKSIRTYLKGVGLPARAPPINPARALHSESSTWTPQPPLPEASTA